MASKRGQTIGSDLICGPMHAVGLRMAAVIACPAVGDDRLGLRRSRLSTLPRLLLFFFFFLFFLFTITFLCVVAVVSDLSRFFQNTALVASLCRHLTVTSAHCSLFVLLLFISLAIVPQTYRYIHPKHIARNITLCQHAFLCLIKTYLLFLLSTPPRSLPYRHSTDTSTGHNINNRTKKIRPKKN
jgi:hypothetical protein